MADFAQRLFDGPLPWAKVRQGHKLLRLGERYTAKRLGAACRRALEVDLIDVRRLERILVQALEAGGKHAPDAPSRRCLRAVSPGPAASLPIPAYTKYRCHSARGDSQ